MIKSFHIPQQAQQAEDYFFPEYDSCMVCPKACRVNRNKGHTGFCRETKDLRIAWAGLHFGEEPPVTGEGGSGTIFITGCNLRCSFCQNYQISQDGMGKIVSVKEFADICLKLQSEKAENINIVTGSHAVPAINASLVEAKKRGLTIPVVWNSSGYDTEESVEKLSGVVDGWLPDLKTFNVQAAEALFKAPDYPAAAKKAVLKMAEQSPLIIDKSDDGKYPLGKMLSGVIVRHLALPSRLPDTYEVLKWFTRNLKDKALLSLMTQYTPVRSGGKSILLIENRLLTKSEDKKLRKLLSECEIENGFYQELVESSDWLPDFTKTKSFSAELSVPFWHWTCGFIRRS